MGVIGNAQSWVLLVLGVAALGVEIFAFVDALRHSTQAYPAAGKRTKPFWLAITGVCLAVGFLTFRGVLSIFGIVAFVGAAVYLADVRPALRQVTGKGSNSSGPYGPW
ncbi:conserved hypothetical protein [Nostocoides japonicum T1-X7]|uniref:Integral membrane protein n=1 Tax=Nostocoides japonicum T1-X7 TaxID=1194083 RepID=A0A077LWC8_9MICO|nr:DUF2516 family protein [Tetrasphaera japonica]CCH78243.1 conserved hypothetical protein [Tetrasphaera japonica T1-X7]